MVLVLVVTDKWAITGDFSCLLTLKMPDALCKYQQQQQQMIGNRVQEEIITNCALAQQLYSGRLCQLPFTGVHHFCSLHRAPSVLDGLYRPSVFFSFPVDLLSTHHSGTAITANSHHFNEQFVVEKSLWDVECGCQYGRSANHLCLSALTLQALQPNRRRRRCCCRLFGRRRRQNI